MFVDIEYPGELVLEVFSCNPDFLVEFIFFVDVEILKKHVESLAVAEAKSSQDRLLEVEVELVHDFFFQGLSPGHHDLEGALRSELDQDLGRLEVRVRKLLLVVKVE